MGGSPRGARVLNWTRVDLQHASHCAIDVLNRESPNLNAARPRNTGRLAIAGVAAPGGTRLTSRKLLMHAPLPNHTQHEATMKVVEDQTVPPGTERTSRH